MSKKMICPNCETQRLVEPIHEERTVVVKGEKYSVSVSLWRCLECHVEFEDREHPIDELDLAYREYRAKYKMLQPEQVKALREDLGLTQAELSKMLGWSPATISRYESGGLQEKSHDNVLQALQEPINFLGLLERRGELLSAERQKDLKNNLKQHLQNKQGHYISCVLELGEADIYSGGCHFDLNKYRAVIHRIVSQCQNNSGVPKTKLNKLLFYVDFLSFKRRQKGITGARYFHFPYGPCPEEYQSLLGVMVDSDFILIEELNLANGNTAEIIKVKGTVEEESLSEDEKTIIDEVCQKLGFKDSKALTDMSHLEKAYTSTNERDVISYEYANYLSLD